MLIGSTLDGNSLIAMLLAAIAAFFLMTGVRRKQRERQRAAEREIGPRRPRELQEPFDQKERLRRDLELLLGELQDLARKISAEIDTRFAKLEASIRDADRRIAVLNRLAHQPGQTPRPAPKDSEEIDARHAAVYELADAGFSCVEIAKDLGKTPGEIELILNLRRTAQQ
jgi:transposase